MPTLLAQPAEKKAAACVLPAGKRPGSTSSLADFPYARGVSGSQRAPHGQNLAPPDVHRVTSSSGRPLSAALLRRFGPQFRNIRIHDGSVADASARAVNARAYTVGHHVVFARGEFSPGNEGGQRLLAHELSHVTQQGAAGRELPVPTRLPIASDDSAAELSARRAAAEGCVGRPPSAASAPVSLQRQAASNEQHYNLALILPPLPVERFANLPRDEAVRALRHFRDRISSVVSGGEEGHRALVEVRSDQYAVGAVSDFLGGVSLPPFSIWEAPLAELRLAEPALAAGDIAVAARHLQAAAKAAYQCNRQVTSYREGTIAGAERSVVGLEVVEVASATAVTVATGGATGVLVGAGYAGAQRLAGEASGVHLGLRDRIDWAGVAFDTLFAAVAGRYGGRLGGAIARRLGGRIAAQVASNLITGRAAGLAHAAARDLFDALRGRTRLTVEGFIDHLAQQLTLRAAFLDLVATAAGMTVAAVMGQGPSPQPSGPGRGASSGRDNVVDLDAARAQRQQGGGPAGQQAGRPTGTRASTGAGAARALAPQEDPQSATQPAAQPVAQAAPEARVIPFPAQAARTAPGGTASTTPGAVAIAASSGPASAASSQPLQVRLELPPEKAIHSDLYRSLVRERRLEHTPNLQRHTAQADHWDDELRPGGPMGMREEIWQAFEDMGVGEVRRLRPDWSRYSDRVSMQVDHRVEWQLLGPGDRQWGDTMPNYELLDARSNATSGSTLRANIQRERADLASRTGNPAWLTQRIVFTQLVVPGSSSGAARWLPEQIQEGEHYHALRRLLQVRSPSH